MQIHRYGADAVLVDVPDAEAAVALYRAARRHGVLARDVVPAAGSVLFDGVDDVEGLVSALNGLTPEAEERGTGSVVEVPTRYDGPDLADVARRWGMTVDEAVRTHAGTEFVVAFCGFAPGFAYCTGLPEPLHVPRHRDPRPRVPAGAVGLAGGFTGVYPTASPGGWRLVGHTDLTLWRPDQESPATLSPGTRVRFTPA